MKFENSENSRPVREKLITVVTSSRFSLSKRSPYQSTFGYLFALSNHILRSNFQANLAPNLPFRALNREPQDIRMASRNIFQAFREYVFEVD